MKNILLVTESPTLREYLATKLESYGLKVIVGISGLDGMLKLRAHSTSLDLIIMDYNLSRMKGREFLSEKQRDPNATSIPVIIISSKIDKDEILAISKMNVKKICSKPIRIDSILNAVSELLKIPLVMDTTKCVLDAHINEDILFIDVSNGLNKEKIELLGYKIRELAELYKMRKRKTLIIMSSLELGNADLPKLDAFLAAVTEDAKIELKAVKILTTSSVVKSFLSVNEKYAAIEVLETLEKAMDVLTGLNVSEFVSEGKSIVKEDFLLVKEAKSEGTFHLKFQAEGEASEVTRKEILIGIIDDDLVAQSIVSNALSSRKYKTKTYDNGKLFINEVANNNFDLIFLDLMMPELDGFGVLAELKDRKITMPIIILSALSQKETVMQAMKFGVHSYIIKPVDPVKILNKAVEILQSEF